MDLLEYMEEIKGNNVRLLFEAFLRDTNKNLVSKCLMENLIENTLLAEYGKEHADRKISHNIFLFQMT